MKKALKIIGIVLAVLLGIAIIVLRIVIPNEMSAIFDKVWEWLNQPLPIVGVSSIVFGFTIWKIFVSTSFGKKGVQKLENEFNELKHDMSVEEQEVSEMLEQTKMFAEETKLMLASFKEELDTFAEQLAVACETSPNKNVQAIAKTIRNKKQEIDTLYAEKPSELSQSVDEVISKEKRLDEMEAEIMGLIEEVKKSKGLGVQNESEE